MDSALSGERMNIIWWLIRRGRRGGFPGYWFELGGSECHFLKDGEHCYRLWCEIRALPCVTGLGRTSSVDNPDYLGLGQTPIRPKERDPLNLAARY